MNRKFRHNAAASLIKFLIRTGGVNPLTFAHRYLGIMNSNMHRNGEEKLLHHLAKQIREPVIFDVGANVGDYSVLAKGIIPWANIHSFEPNPKSFAELERIKPEQSYNVALGNEPGTAELHVPEERDTSSHATMISDAVAHRNAAVQSVEVKTLESVMSELGVQHIDLLKIDCEGFEYDVLLGAGSALDRISMIQFEFNFHLIYRKLYLKDFYALLTDFEFFRMSETRLQHLGPYDPVNEIFQMHNLLAVRKDRAKYWIDHRKW